MLNLSLNLGVVKYFIFSPYTSYIFIQEKFEFSICNIFYYFLKNQRKIILKTFLYQFQSVLLIMVYFNKGPLNCII